MMAIVFQHPGSLEAEQLLGVVLLLQEAGPGPGQGEAGLPVPRPGPPGLRDESLRAKNAHTHLVRRAPGSHLRAPILATSPVWAAPSISRGARRGDGEGRAPRVHRVLWQPHAAGEREDRGQLGSRDSSLKGTSTKQLISFTTKHKFSNKYKNIYNVFLYKMFL